MSQLFINGTYINVRHQKAGELRRYLNDHDCLSLAASVVSSRFLVGFYTAEDVQVIKQWLKDNPEEEQ